MNSTHIYSNTYLNEYLIAQRIILLSMYLGFSNLNDHKHVNLCEGNTDMCIIARNYKSL